MKRIRFRASPLLACGVLAITSLGAAPGDSLYVKRPAVALRSGKFSFDPVIATAVMGDTVKVTAVEGKWARVAYHPTSFAATRPETAIEGYVVQDALSVQPIAATQPSDSGDAGSAGSGLSASDYAAAKGLSSDAFNTAVNDSHEAMKNADAKFDAFTRAGHLGPHKSDAPTTQPSR